jgi:hypothetical protein
MVCQFITVKKLVIEIMKKIFGYISIVLFFMSCSDTGETFKETSEGLVYAYRIDNLQSPKPKNGDRLLLKVAYYNESDSLLFDSREISHRFVQEYIEPQDTTPSIYHIYQMLSQGDSITAKINAEHFFEVHRKDGLPPGIQQGEMLRFEVKLDSIFSPEEFISKSNKVTEKNQQISQSLQFITPLLILPEILFIRVQKFKSHSRSAYKTKKYGRVCVKACNICEKADMQSSCSLLT